MTLHAQDRALQRYNKELTEKDMICIQKAIMNNQHTPLYSSKDDKNKKFCYLKHDHIPYKILYTIRKKQCRIITIYPFDVDEYNNMLEEKEKEKIEKSIAFLKSKGYVIYKNPRK